MLEYIKEISDRIDRKLEEVINYDINKWHIVKVDAEGKKEYAGCFSGTVKQLESVKELITLYQDTSIGSDTTYCFLFLDRMIVNKIEEEAIKGYKKGDEFLVVTQRGSIFTSTVDKDTLEQDGDNLVIIETSRFAPECKAKINHDPHWTLPSWNQKVGKETSIAIRELCKKISNWLVENISEQKIVSELFTE